MRVVVISRSEDLFQRRLVQPLSLLIFLKGHLLKNTGLEVCVLHYRYDSTVGQEQTKLRSP